MLTDTTTGPRFKVGAHTSIAVELEWVLAAARRDDFRAAHPTLVRVYEDDPDLLERARSFWGPEATGSCTGYMELMVLAHQVGMLLSDDADALLARLEEACTMPVDEDAHALHSETEEDRQAVFVRLRALRASSDLRRRYVALAADAWGAVRDDWERYGRGAVELAVETRREALGRGTDWHEVVRSGCFGELLDRCASGLRPDGELAVIPAFFTHKGLLFDLPGVVVVGVRIDTTGLQARARTEVLARRLKAISDPTRLAILDALRSGPHTVTELAAAFALAQPTVSNHVRVLREAGLVTDERDGTRRNLIVRPDAADDLLSNLRGVLAGSAHAHDAEASVTTGP